MIGTTELRERQEDKDAKRDMRISDVMFEFFYCPFRQALLKFFWKELYNNIKKLRE